MTQIISSFIILCIFIIVSFYGASADENIRKEDYLSQNNSNSLRGIVAIAIVLQHFSGWFIRPYFLIPFKHFGYLGVALFFFLSGYGLYYSFKNKEDYLKFFWKKRLLSLLIPYYIANILYIIVEFIMGEDVRLLDVISSIYGGYLYISVAWYIFVLILLYAVFYISFKMKSSKVSSVVFTVLFITLTVILYAFKGNDPYTRSLFAFPAGIIWYKYKATIDKYIHRKWYFCFVLSLLLLGFGFGFKIIGTLYRIPMIVFAANNFSSMFFCVFILIFISKIRLNNKCISFIGKISMEVYLYHMLILNLLGRIFSDNKTIGVWGLFLFAILIPLSILMNKVNMTILRRIDQI